MRNILLLGVIAFGTLVAITICAGSAYASQAAGAVSSVNHVTAGRAVDSVVGTNSTIPVQLVRNGRGGGGGGRGGGAGFRGGGGGFRGGGASFRSSGGGFRASSFRGGRFHGGHVRHHRHFRPFVFGGFYAPFYGSYYAGGPGYYEEDDQVCVWNGYTYRCYTVY